MMDMFMLKSTHEAAVRELKAKAARDIEPLTREVRRLKEDLGVTRQSLRQRTADLDRAEGQEELSERLIAELREEADALRPDAQKWRDRADREAKRGQARKGKPVAAKAGVGR